MSVKPSTKICTPSSTPSRVKVAVTMLNRTITPRTTDASPPTSRPQRCSGTANDMATRVTPLARNSAPAARVRVSAAARVLRRINTPSTASSAPPGAEPEQGAEQFCDTDNQCRPAEKPNRHDGHQRGVPEDDHASDHEQDPQQDVDSGLAPSDLHDHGASLLRVGDPVVSAGCQPHDGPDLRRSHNSPH